MNQKRKKPPRVSPLSWGQVKKRVSFLLTPTAKLILLQKAESSEVTKSEFIERSVRWINPYSLLKAGSTDELGEGNRVAILSWGEGKEPFGFRLSPVGKEVLEAKAEEIGITRSEFLERLIRTVVPSVLVGYTPDEFGSLSVEECLRLSISRK